MKILLTVVNGDSSLVIAIVGVVGIIVGALFSVLGNVLLHYLQNKRKDTLDESRKDLLFKMLDNDRFPNKWRKLETLSRVIGADDETTKRLLIEIGARGSESEGNSWGLIKYHPLDKIENA
jgi:hypothetical protein